uniref:Costars domain-containing protein n=1 Tax=Anopheles coluzzii TaxID=1518534 RepID=A0A8W7PLZ6_ANOCL
LLFQTTNVQCRPVAKESPAVTPAVLCVVSWCVNKTPARKHRISSSSSSEEGALLDRIHKMTDVAHELGALRLIVMGGIVSRVFRGAPEHSNCQKCQRSCCICLDTGLELTQRRLLRLEERERRRSRAGSIASRRFLSDVELEEEEEELELEEVLPRTRPASRRSLRRPAAQRPRRPAQPEPEEEEEPAEEEEEQPAPQPRQRPRARTTTVRRQAPARRPRRAQPQQEVEPEEEEEEEEPAPRPARAPQRAQQSRQRAQPRRAQRQPQPQEEPEEEDNGEEEEEEQQQPPRRARPQAPQPPRRQQPAARRRNNPPAQEEPEEEEDPAPEEEQAPARRRQRTQRTRTQQQRRRTQRPAEEDLSTGTEELEELEEELGREARLRRLERRLLLEEDHLRGRMLRDDELRRQRSCRRRHQQQQQKQHYQLSLDRRQQREPEPEVVRGPNVRRLVACYELKRSDISETDAQSLQNLFTQDSPLSSKVALFNQTAQSHRESQLSNPFSDAQASRGMARLQISKEEYGKPKAGSLTEYRGKKANIQVYQEMLELCQVIDVDGKPVSKKNPDIKMIYFGELFNIYTHINDKLVGLLLRARKHDLIQFEGECLFQRRDDHVPVYLTKPVAQIRDILVGKQTEIRRSLSPNPQPTNMLP